MDLVEVGDIFVSDWGYEQTNIDYCDYYKVTRKMKKAMQTVKITMTRRRTTEESAASQMLNQMTMKKARRAMLTRMWRGRAMPGMMQVARMPKMSLMATKGTMMVATAKTAYLISSMCVTLPTPSFAA